MIDEFGIFLNENPKIKVAIHGHTDDVGNDAANMTLSDNRAKSAVAYLVKRGISKDRLTWKGYGETKLVNGCTNDVKCTEDEHQRNRRTTFKVLSY